jgi:cytoskeletal protein RodZ
MDVGILLRNARERRRLSIEELSAATKIPVTVLRAIEAGDFARVPGGIFARGFLRACAREVGLNPEEVVAHFVAGAEHVRDADSGSADLATATVAAADTPAATPRRRAAQLAWLAAAAVAWIVIARGLATGPSPADTPIAEPPNPGVSGPADSGAPSPTAQAVAEAPIGTAGRALRIEIEPVGDCWVEAAADGHPALYRLMRAGEREALDVDAELVLRVGDPGAFAYQINGHPGRVLGAPSTPITLRITPANYEDLLAR